MDIRSLHTEVHSIRQLPVALGTILRAYFINRIDLMLGTYGWGGLADELLS